MKVVDVSTWQGKINWDEAKKHIDGVIIRCGYGDDIGSQDDEQFLRNISECERLAIPHGVYLYSYATNEAHMQSEVNHILRLIKGRKLQFPVYIDLEDEALRPYFNAELFRRMGDRIEEAGYWFGVYANLDWFRNTIGNSLDRFTKWVAQYNSKCDYTGGHDMWQYTNQGTVPGIGSGNIDMNECYRDFPKEITSGREEVEKPTENKPEKVNKNFDAFIRARTQKHGWLPEVKNLEDFAGFEESPITDIAIRVSAGSVKYRVHVIGAEWLPYVTGYNINDHVNGYAGNGKSIDAIEVYFYTPDGYVVKRAKYRIAPCSGSYYPYQYDNETGNGQDGYAGVFGVKIGKVQLCIE